MRYITYYCPHFTDEKLGADHNWRFVLMSYSGGTSNLVNSKDCALKKVNEYFYKRTGIQPPMICPLSGKEDVPLT